MTLAVKITLSPSMLELSDALTNVLVDPRAATIVRIVVSSGLPEVLDPQGEFS